MGKEQHGHQERKDHPGNKNDVYFLQLFDGIVHYAGEYFIRAGENNQSKNGGAEGGGDAEKDMLCVWVFFFLVVTAPGYGA